MKSECLKAIGVLCLLLTACVASAAEQKPNILWITGIHPVSTGTIYMRSLYDSGTQAAFIVRIPEKFKHLWPAAKPGARIDRLISFTDMPKTWLAITKSAIPPEMQGSVFLGEQQDPPRDHVFMARERMDEAPDMQRALRDHRYLYTRNYEPFRPNGQFLEYLWHAPSMRSWEAHHSSAAESRAWATVMLLGSKAKGIEGLLKTMQLDKKDQDALSLFQSRLE